MKLSEHPIHPWYGPCDGLADGECAECTETARRVNERLAVLETTCQNIVALASGWDKDGALGPRPPLSWETVARMAMDYARSALPQTVRVELGRRQG